MIKWGPKDVNERMRRALMPEAQPQNTQSLLEQLKARAGQVRQIPSRLMQRK